MVVWASPSDYRGREHPRKPENDEFLPMTEPIPNDPDRFRSLSDRLEALRSVIDGVDRLEAMGVSDRGRQALQTIRIDAQRSLEALVQRN